MKPRRLTKALARVLRKISRGAKHDEDSHEWVGWFGRVITGDMARATVDLAEPGRRMRYARRYRDQLARADGPPAFGAVAPFDRIREELRAEGVTIQAEDWLLTPEDDE